MSLVHDNEVLSYEVDLRREKIILHTLYDSRGLIEYTDVNFDGVLCHMFEHQLQGSIILDINDYELELFFKNKENIKLLDKNKDYGWPLIYDNIDQFKEKLRQAEYKYIVIMSAYGLNGWVLAKDYKIQVKQKEEVKD
ncbi:hypothetical protein MKX50_02460 [Paenibacillus sp. FSL W8-0186]|uniref:hypothetical protein n=1 Tax=Paenibacillus sp. FSL W8-0186 TaxID=2921709 RepID=UPI0030CDC443